MDKRVVLAVAGAGKTHYLCSEIDKNKRNLIIAYTNQNIKNIYNEVIKQFGCVPSNTVIMTFHSFVYKYLVRPFDKSIGKFYGINNFYSKGITIEPPPLSSYTVNGKHYKNNQYHKVNTLDHYIKNNRYYSSYLSKLIIKTKSNEYSLLSEGCKSIKKFFDSIYIDEMQDFREYNWRLLSEIINNVNNILLVGDYYQHSVSGANNSGEPFNGIKNYQEYIEYLTSLNLVVDDKRLIKSRRCSKKVCEFIKNKLDINIESAEINNGSVIFLHNPIDIRDKINDDSIIKLVWDKANIYNFNSINWGYSKGDTYESICIILTDAYSELEKDDFINNQSVISTNKLYVALSRSKGNVYIIKKEDYVNNILTK